MVDAHAPDEPAPLGDLLEVPGLDPAHDRGIDGDGGDLGSQLLQVAARLLHDLDPLEPLLLALRPR